MICTTPYWFGHVGQFEFRTGVLWFVMVSPDKNLIMHLHGFVALTFALVPGWCRGVSLYSVSHQYVLSL